MNRLHSWKICAAMAALLLFTACSQDELTEQGTPLPAGQYPLELTADGLQAVATPEQLATRGTFFEGDWDGVTSVKVRVNDKEEKEYSVEPSADKKTARLTPAEPLESTDELFWWTSSTEKKTITAWTPSEYILNKTIEFPTEWTKEDFAKYDIIGVRKTIGFEGKNEPLVFQHMMAKFVINLRKTPYLENAENVKVQLDGASWKYGHMYIDSYRGLFQMGNKAGQYGEYITPYHLPEADYEDVDFGSGSPEKPFASYMALVPPLDGRVSPLLIIEVDGVKYQLLQDSFTDENNVSYRGGQVYTFNVTVKENGLDVTVEETIGWGTDGATGSGSVTLPDEVINLGDGIPVEIKDDRTYLITGTGTQTITIDGSPTITFKEVSLNSGTAIEITGGSPKLVFEGTNSLESTANGKGAISLSGGASVDISGGGTLSLKANTTDMYGDGWIEGAILGSAGGEQCGNISISGVTLDIEANIYNAAIGSGEYNSSCGDIIITDATIHITGCKGGAGIGTSRANAGTSSCGDIRIKNSDIEIEYGNMSALQGAAIGCAAGGLSSSSSTYYPNTVKGIYVTLKSGQSQSDFLDKLTTTSATGSDKVGYGYNESDNRKYGSITDGIHWYDAGGTEINE